VLSFDPFNLPGGMCLPKIPPFFSAGLAVSRVQNRVFVNLDIALPGAFESRFGHFSSEMPVTLVCCERVLCGLSVDGRMNCFLAVAH
jgi:hypothetical protein